MHSQIRNKTFQIPVPQTKKNYKNDTLTKSRARDEELTFVQTASSLALKSVFHFYFFYVCSTVISQALFLIL